MRAIGRRASHAASEQRLARFGCSLVLQRAKLSSEVMSAYWLRGILKQSELTKGRAFRFFSWMVD